MRGYWRFSLVVAAVAAVLNVPFLLWEGRSLAYALAGSVVIAGLVLLLFAAERAWERFRGRGTT